MSEPVQKLFSEIGDNFEARNLVELAESFDFPLALYFKSKTLVFGNADELVATISALRQDLDCRNLARIQSRIITRSALRDGNQAVSVAWTLIDRWDQVIAIVKCRFFCGANANGDILIRLGECPMELSGAPSKNQPVEIQATDIQFAPIGAMVQAGQSRLNWQLHAANLSARPRAKTATTW